MITSPIKKIRVSILCTSYVLYWLSITCFCLLFSMPCSYVVKRVDLLLPCGSSTWVHLQTPHSSLFRTTFKLKQQILCWSLDLPISLLKHLLTHGRPAFHCLSLSLIFCVGMISTREWCFSRSSYLSCCHPWNQPLFTFKHLIVGFRLQFWRSSLLSYEGHNHHQHF